MATLRAARLIFANDLRRRLRNRSFVVQCLIGPIVLSVVVSLAFGSDPGFDVTIGVRNDDRGALADDLVEGLVAASVEGVELVELPRDADAARFVDDQDGSAAVLVIPDGFTGSLGQRAAEPLQVYRDPRNEVAAAVATSVAQELAARIDVGRLATAALVAEGRDAPSPSELADVDLPIALGRRATDEQSPVSSVGPGMGLLFLFLGVSFVARNLLEEKRLRVLDRMRAAPVSVAAVLIGKCLGVVVVGIVSLLTLWAATALLLGAEWGPAGGVVLLIVAISTAVAGLAGVVAALARSEQGADMIATGAAFALGILGGSLVPLSELPEGLARLSWLTPNGWALHAFAELSAGQGTVASILPHLGVLALWALGFGSLAVVLLPRRLAAR